MSATFEEAIQPLLEAHAALEADVSELESELAALKEKRNRLRNAVRALDPERLPSPNGKPKKPQEQRVGQVSVDYVRAFLQSEDFPPGEFGSTQLVATPGYAGVGPSTLPTILRILHDEGIIRLVRKGKGASRYYEVIR